MTSEMGHLSGGTAELIAQADEREAAEAASRPDEPSLPPLEWLKVNLFSSWLNAGLTVIFGIFGILTYRGLLNWAFSYEREWDAVRVNMRALFTFTYPSSQYGRIWVTLAIVLALAGLSLGMSRMIGRGFSLKRISIWAMSWGGAVIAGILLTQPHPQRTADGEVLLDDAPAVTFVWDDASTYYVRTTGSDTSDGSSPARQQVISDDNSPARQLVINDDNSPA